jgi:hypothetical protein
MAGTIVADQLQDGAGNSTSMDNAIYGSAKAWVQFNATTGARNGSYNVSSVTRSAAGTYIVNYTNAMANANYAFTFGVGYTSTGITAPLPMGVAAPTTTSLSFNTYGRADGGLYDYTYVSLAVFD